MPSEKIIDSITFEKVNQQHQKNIFQWLAEPHMQEFWDNTPEHKEDILNFIQGRTTPSNYFNGIFTYWVGILNDEPFCLIMTSEVHSHEEGRPLWKEHISKTGRTYTIDFGIGNKDFLGKGLAAPTLEKFTQFYHTQVDALADTFFIDPDINNPRAQHVYEKAGVNMAGVFEMACGTFTGQQTYLMVKKLTPSSHVQQTFL